MKKIVIVGKGGNTKIVRLTCHSCECMFDATIDEFINGKTKCPECESEVSLFFNNKIF